MGGEEDRPAGRPDRRRGDDGGDPLRSVPVQRRVAVLVASLSFVGLGAALAGWLLWRDRGRAHEGVTDPWHAPPPIGDGASTAAVSEAGDADAGGSIVATNSADAGGIDSAAGADSADHEPAEAARQLRVVPGHANRERGQT